MNATTPIIRRVATILSMLGWLVGVIRAQDITPPQLIAFNLSPTAIDTTAAPAAVTVTFSATDDSSGVSYVEVAFVDPFGVAAQRISAVFPPSVSLTSSRSVTFPRFSTPGPWKVGKVLISDLPGITEILVTARLAA